MPPSSAGGFAMPPASIGAPPPPAVPQSHAAPPSLGPPPPGGLPAGPPRPGPQGHMTGPLPTGPPTSQMSAPRGMYPGNGPPMSGGGPPMPGAMPPMQPPPVSGGPQQPPMPGGMPPMGSGHPMPGTQAPPRGGMPPPMGGVHGPSMTQPGGQLPPGGAPPIQAQPFNRQPQPGLQPGFQPQGPPGGQFGAANQNNRRTLDPDQMPSPIQVMEEDQRNSNGYFDTREKGQPPPLVTTNFITRDFGNASPRFIRSTMYYVPATEDMRKQTGVPFGIVLSPLAKVAKDEIEPPVTDFGPSGIVNHSVIISMIYYSEFFT